MLRIVLLCAVLAACAGAADLRPFEIVWDPAGEVLVDVSFLLDAPAGKHGFVTIRDGHLAAGDGKRLRLWGVNTSFTGSLPSKELAPKVAAHLARFGINCVRVHHLDWRTPRGIIDSRYPDSRHLDPEMLDRLDFFLSELKKRGIYTNLNLNVARAFQDADGVKDAADLGFAKALTYFDPRLIELQKEYARTLLAHKNPYTGNEYRNEPAVAIVEIVNENSLVESWVRGRLRGKGPGKAQDRTWVDIPASYERDLTTLYRQWLARNLTPDQLARLRAEAGAEEVPRLRPEEFARASEFRFRTEASFYMDLEDRFFQDMYAYLKKDLGVKALITGTSVHAAGLTPYPLLGSTSKLDIVDAHTYWQHPRYLSDPATGRRTGFEIPNTPSLNEPARSAVVTLSRAAFAGKPFMVSEVNHPYPNEYAAEGIPLLAAYGAFQDWDAIFWYSFSHSAAETWGKPSLPGHFDMRQDPVKMTQWAAAAVTFLRGDVRPAARLLSRSYSREQVIDSLRLPASEQPYFTPKFPPLLPLVHGSRISSLTGRATDVPVLAIQQPYASDTGELRWSLSAAKKGSVVVNTARTQALIGYWSGGEASAGNLRAALKNPFGALMLVSLDGAPIARASRLLLSAASRTANTGMKWNETRTATVDPGTPGMRIETLEGSVALTGIEGAKEVEAVPLDGGGRSAGAALRASRHGGEWRLELGSVVTPWYLVRVVR